MKRLYNTQRYQLIGVQYILLAVMACGLSAPAAASTATYVEPANLSSQTEINLSTAGDNAGAFLGLGDTLALVFDEAFGAVRREGISIFTLPPSRGAVFFSFSFGTYNNGSPVFAFSNQVRAGRNFTVNNPFARGCSALGGCDYIEITVTRTRGGATGAEVDYVAVDGQVTQVTSPTPEPSAWALMISGFLTVAWRLKHTRRKSARAEDREIADGEALPA